MAIITTGLLIVGGVAAVLGVGGAIWAACTEEERKIKERINQLDNENKQLNAAISVLSKLNQNIENAQEYLTSGNEIFANGGHVFSGVALANSENKTCYDKLNVALENSKALIEDLTATITKNDNEITTEKGKL